MHTSTFYKYFGIFVCISIRVGRERNVFLNSQILSMSYIWSRRFGTVGHRSSPIGQTMYALEIWIISLSFVNFCFSYFYKSPILAIFQVIKSWCDECKNGRPKPMRRIIPGTSISLQKKLQISSFKPNVQKMFEN